ncbi:MAG: AsmA protein, partial [Candidatus Binataceae bacterium]|nr:AsmA protein [Candidatus Binataceae bacterium]
SIKNGTVIYQAAGASSAATVNSIDLTVEDFDFDSAFEVAVTFAALSDKQNFDLSATIGPLRKNGVLDVNAIPVSAKASVGPILLSQLKALPMLAKSIPPKLTISDPISFEAAADGTVDWIKFHASSDLSAAAIAFGDSFNKPPGVPLKISAEGSRVGSAVNVALANVTLGDLAMKATNIKVAGGTTSARVDTNRFDLASLAKVIPALAKYSLDGKSEIHSNVIIAGGKPSAHGTVSLADVGLSQPDQKTPPISHLSGNIKLAGTSADVGPLTFNLGAQQATLTSHVDQFQPLVASYELSAVSLHLADLAPARPADEHMDQLLAKGSVSIQSIGPVVDGQITSSAGNLAGVAYQNLNLNASLEGKHARVLSLKIKAFSGDVVATADVRFEPAAPFNASISFTNLNVQQMLDAQKAKAAGIVRGTLGGNMNVSAKIGTFDEMKPTMQGNGRLMLTNGKLVGVNIGGETLKKVQNLPAIGDLVPMAVVKNHPELFSNPDTDIQIASLTYVLAGPRITSHDIKVQTVDYNLLGDGWFDMDKNVDLAARIVLAPAFSKELIEQKQQVAYVANQDGQIDIPLQITGQLPKPSILPNVTELAQRAATHAAQAQGQKYIGKYLGKKGLPAGIGEKLPGGLGKFLSGGDSGNAPDNGTGADNSGSGNSGSAPSDGGSKPPPNPLDQLKKLF